MTVLNIFFDHMGCNDAHTHVMVDRGNDGLMAVNGQNDMKGNIVFPEMMSEPVFNGLCIVSVSDEILSRQVLECMIVSYRFRIVLPRAGQDDRFLYDRGEMVEVEVTEKTILGCNFHFNCFIDGTFELRPSAAQGGSYFNSGLLDYLTTC